MAAQQEASSLENQAALGLHNFKASQAGFPPGLEKAFTQSLWHHTRLYVSHTPRVQSRCD